MLIKATKLMKVVLLLLSMSLKGYSQKTLLNNGDTTICFTVGQAKFLLKNYYNLEKFIALDSICETQLSYCDSLSNLNKTIIESKSKIISAQKTILLFKNDEVGNLKLQFTNQTKELQRQRNLKRLWVIVSGVGASFFMYYIITN